MILTLLILFWCVVEIARISTRLSQYWGVVVGTDRIPHGFLIAAENGIEDLTKRPPQNSILQEKDIQKDWWWWLYFLTAINGSSTFEFIQQGEYFQSIRILIKHWWFLHKNWQRKTPESESEKRHIGVQQSKILILNISTKNAKSLTSGQVSLTPH